MKNANVVLEGGGVRGIGLVGALGRLNEWGVTVKGIGGTSAGAMVAAMHAAGYSPDEMYQILLKTSFNRLLDPSHPVLWNIWRHYGVHKGKKIHDWLRKLLRDRNLTLFQDLKDTDLKIVASDVTNKKLIVFDKVQYPRMEVALAVRMSIGIPFFFEAYKWGDQIVVDGGILSNYPLSLFASDRDVPTIGLKLVSDADLEPPEPPKSLFGYLHSLAATMMEAHDKEDEREFGRLSTIHIPTGKIGTTQFNLTEEQKRSLFLAGYQAATRFLDESGPTIFGREKGQPLARQGAPDPVRPYMQALLDVTSNPSGDYRAKIEHVYEVAESGSRDDYVRCTTELQVIEGPLVTRRISLGCTGYAQRPERFEDLGVIATISDEPCRVLPVDVSNKASMEAVILLYPPIESGEESTLVVAWHWQGLWDDLRIHGEDGGQVIIPNERVEALAVTIKFPRGSQNPRFLRIPAGSQAQMEEEDGKPFLTWVLPNPSPGTYEYRLSATVP